MKLGLGTVQFGTQYGISNSGGRTLPAEVARVLEYADRAGIEILDTAAAYGDSEAVLGEILQQDCRFKIVTKLSRLDSMLGKDEWARALHDGLCASLERLRLDAVYGVLLHRTADVMGPMGAERAAALQELKRNGLVQKIGVSVYSAAELDAVLGNFMPDIVQAPSNAIDQRLWRDGWLTRLHNAGVELHLRSAFLQGLLLMPTNQRPAIFHRYREPLNRFDQFCERHDLTPLEAALGYARQVPGQAVIVGVTKRSELEEIVSAMEAAVPSLEEFVELACDDEELVNPSKWQTH